MIVELRENKLIILIDGRIYNEEVLHKCFYWYCGNYSVEITKDSDSGFKISLSPKVGQQFESDISAFSEKIKRDLIDFKLRDIVTKETKTIRELIVAKAFAYYGIDDNPVSNVSDPLGFNPESILENE